jgi:uncharacterized membrane protein YphA (DoxX/SURF4 family)
MRANHLLLWVARLIAAVILLQTLWFKFSGAPESVELFSKLGVEPWGRITTGCLEGLTAILLLWPAFSHWGAFMGLGIMTGAIASHLFIIGIESNGDGGQLFYLAIITWICCAAIVYWNRKKFFSLLQTFRSEKRLV